MLKISKQEFCSNIKAIEHELNFYEALKDLNILVERNNRLFDIVIDDVCELIDWYLFEQPNDDDKTIVVTSDSMDIYINVDSPQKLYELLFILDEDNVYDDKSMDIN